MPEPKSTEAKAPEAAPPYEPRKLTKKPVQIHFHKNAQLTAPTDFVAVIERAYAIRNGIKPSPIRLVVDDIFIVSGIGLGFKVQNRSEGKRYETERIVPWASVAGVDFEP